MDASPGAARRCPASCPSAVCPACFQLAKTLERSKHGASVSPKTRHGRLARSCAARLSKMLLTGLITVGLNVSPALRRTRVPHGRPSVRLQGVTEDTGCEASDMDLKDCGKRTAPFNKVMAANRAEIAVRIMRAATELNMQTVAIYGYEDRYSQHRARCNHAFGSSRW